jgi:hypothetical protein
LRPHALYSFRLAGSWRWVTCGKRDDCPIPQLLRSWWRRRS